MKKIFLTLLITFTLIQCTFSQCTGVSVNSISNFNPISIDSLTEANGLRNGPDYNGATLYYPSTLVGNFKSIVLVPGFLATQSSIAPWARFFASRGFVCMTIGTNSTLDFPNIRALALLDGMETMRQENNRMASPLYQKIDTSKIAVGGWSMGGGGAQLAAKLDSRINAVFAIAPWLDPGTLTPASLNHTSPLFILSGQVDPTAPPAQHANVHYDYTPNTTEKLLFEIVGGNHSTPLAPSTNNGKVGNLVFAWLNLSLNNDSCYCNIVKNDSMNINSTASFFQNNISCGTVSSIKEENKLLARLFPNPATSEINLKADSKLLGSIYIVYDNIGKIIIKGKINSEHTVIELSDFSSGVFFLRIDEKSTPTLKFIKE